MSDINTVMQAYEIHARALAEANSLNKTVVFEALAAASITTVTVTFDGEGDSGQIEDITAYAGDGPQPLPDIQVEIQHVSWGTGKLDGSQSPLRYAIETLCYDFLSQEHAGWENNDGAFGEFAFDVAARRIDLEFSARFSDFTTSSHTF